MCFCSKAGGPRYERPLSQSKQALSTMLRARHPSAQFLQGPGSSTQHQGAGVSGGTGPGGAMPGTMGGSHLGGPGAGGPMPGHPGTHPGGSGPTGFSMEMMQKRQMMIRQQLRPQGMPVNKRKKSNISNMQVAHLVHFFLILC